MIGYSRRSQGTHVRRAALRVRRLCTISGAVVLALLSAPAHAQPAGIEWRVDALTIEPGEVVDSQLVLTNTASPEDPQALIPDGVHLQLMNTHPVTMSQTTITNNVRTQTTTYTYTLRLWADREGVYTVGPVSVRAGGVTYTADPVTLTVRRSPAAARRGDQLVWVGIDAEPTALYVSQSVRATLSIGIRKVNIAGRRYEMNLLGIVDGSASNLSVFPRSGWTSSTTYLDDSEGRRHEYEVFRVSAAVPANDVGTLRIGPVFIQANYPLAVRRGFFGDEVTRSRRESARADAIEIQVKAPPLDGRPADYSGALGSFEMKVDAQPRRVEQGQPVTLTIAFRGAPLGGIAPPNLARITELVSRFDFASDEMVGDMNGEWKVFRRAIFPRKAGEQTVPAITWSYFDIPGERYVTLSSEPIAIVVDPPPPAAGPSLTFTLPTPAPREPELTLLTGGLSPNYIDVDGLLVAQEFAPGVAHAAALAAPPLAWLLVLIAVRRRRYWNTHHGEARRRRALKNACAALDRAARINAPADLFPALARALTGYVSDRLNLDARALTPVEVRAALAARGVHPELLGEICAFLDQADALRYAGSVNPDPRAADVRRVRQWLELLERQTE